MKSATGNAAAAGLKSGDDVIYTSSFFGDELWPADQLGFVNSAIKVDAGAGILALCLLLSCALRLPRF